MSGFCEQAEECAVDVMRSPDYDKLLEYGLDQRVAEKLDEIYKVKLVSLIRFGYSVPDPVGSVII